MLMDEAIERKWIVEEDLANRRGIARARVVQEKIVCALKSQLDEDNPRAVIDPPTETEIDIEERDMRIVEAVCSSR